ncbi:MAG: SDR family NAD(P)-dependent oxidoreductase [Candidatus Omnitrophica bacterium]|nr:SDR family NAD(P)-dependent oxidoreductase [Candidatus Omnitrophota bacterium]
MKKRVLVTGAGGFIGSHLAEALVKKGYEVRAFVHYNSFNSWGWIDRIDEEIKNSLEIFNGDIQDPHGVRKAMEGCEMVFHLAALVGIPYSYRSPESYVDTNIKGTLNILQAAKELGIKKIIQTSTSEVYGTACRPSINEQHRINPQSPYAATKAAADFLTLAFYRSFNLPTVLMRPFNNYGPRQSARAIIPTIITQILAGSKIIKIGSLYPERDLVYVADTVRGFIGGAESKSAVGNIINIGTNSTVTIRALAGIIMKLMRVNKKIEIQKERVRPKGSEVERLKADITKAKKIINWSPQYNLEQGLEKTIAWLRKNHHLYKPFIYNV